MDRVPYYLGAVRFRKEVPVMSDKLKSALDYLAKAAAVLAVVAEAGKKVMSLCKG